MAWTLLLLFVRLAVAEEELVWTGPGSVLLKNGNVLTAMDITPQGKIVSVRLDETGDVRIPSKDIVKIGRDKLELYYHQVSTTTRWEAGEHWQLAKWCLRQGLVEQSHAHYEQLKKLSGNHAKFKQLDSELKQALLQDPVMKAALRSAFQLEQASQALHQVSESETNPVEVAKDRIDTSKPVVALDQPTQDYFRQHLQPFLAMRCGQAGCHGAYGKSDFHVAKSGVLHGRPANEVSLTSALRFLDAESIEGTKLWINATSPHGTLKTPSLTTKDSAERELLNRLRTWHQAVLRKTAVVTMSPMVQVSTNASATNGLSASPSPMDRLPVPPMLTAEQSMQPRPQPNAVRPSQPPAPDLGDDLMMLEKEIAKLEEKERAKKSTRRHDPEEFNRRFGNTNP